MKIYFWLADKLFYLGTSTLKRKLNFEKDQELNIEVPVLIYHSKSKNWGRALLMIIAFSAIGIAAIRFDLSFTIAGHQVDDWRVGFLLGLTLSISPIYKGILNRPIIKIDQASIESERFGKLKWEEIDAIEIENVINDLDENPFLLIRNDKKRFRVSVEDLTKSQEDIEQIVGSLWMKSQIK